MSGEIVGRSLTYVEADVDLYRLTQFEAARDGVAVANWAVQWNATTSMVGAISADMPSGRAARLQKAGGNRSAWTWNSVPLIANVSAVALLRSQVASPINMGVTLRGSGGDGTDNLYLLRLSAGTTIDLFKTTAGAALLLATISFAHVHNENLWLRFDAANVAGPGVLLRGKVWRGALSDEPSSFMIDATDTSSPHTGAGKAGLYVSSAGSDILCGHFRAKSLLGSSVETLRFAKSTDYLPRDIDAVPDLLEASLSPGTISLGENLGERSTLTVALKDHRGADLGELFDSGTQWGKARARQIFRRGQPIRVKRGLLGQALSEFETRHYVFDSFSGPSPQGGASLVAKDVLKLADDDRALAPRPSNGFLSAGITNVATAATLLPVGIGNAEYPTSGHIAIGGKEVCAFTRVGDALTLTRAQFGTTAIAHNAEDRVQLCLNFNGVDPADIIHALFTTYAAISASVIPLAVWQQETDIFLQRVYTRLIAEPTGVSKLVSELISQAGLVVWWDDRLSQIRLQVLRGIATDAFLYTQRNVIRGSLQVQDQPEKQITQVWSYYGVRNPLEPLNNTDNFRSALATVDLEAETANGSPVIRTIFGTWIPALARSTAQRVNDLQIGRFVRAPRKIAFDVMRYSGVQEPGLGGGYRIEWWGNQDEAGNVVNAPIQITRINPMADRIRAEAEEMLFKQFDADDLKNRTIVVDGNFNNLNARTTHDSIYGVPTAQDIIDGVNLTVIVNESVIVGSATTAQRAMESGEFPTVGGTGNIANTSPIVTNLSIDPTDMKVGTPVTGAGIQAKSRILTIDSPTQITLDKPAIATTVGVALTFWFYVALEMIGRIQGAGGKGGNGQIGLAPAVPQPGQAGGVALYVQHPILLTDTGGQIWSGGGGGGGGDNTGWSGGGGGGAGQVPGIGGQGYDFATPDPAFSGANGTTESGGAGGVAPGNNNDGGAGGGPGLAGSAGNGSGGAAGGAPGAAIDGISFVTTVGSPGDRRGSQIN